jgi:hypothetical protein
MKTRVIIFLVIIFLFAAVGCSGSGPEGEGPDRFIYYYENVALLLEENKDDPERGLKELQEFMDKYKEDYIAVTKEVNNLPDDKMKVFVETYADRISAALDLYWETAFTPIGENEEVEALLEQIPFLDLNRVDKFFPK